jgi:hypothetical protein
LLLFCVSFFSIAFFIFIVVFIGDQTQHRVTMELNEGHSLLPLDLYEILELQKGYRIPIKVIKERYFQLLPLYHPERLPPDLSEEQKTDCLHRLEWIKFANEVFSNREYRDHYYRTSEFPSYLIRPTVPSPTRSSFKLNFTFTNNNQQQEEETEQEELQPVNVETNSFIPVQELYPNFEFTPINLVDCKKEARAMTKEERNYNNFETLCRKIVADQKQNEDDKSSIPKFIEWSCRIMKEVNKWIGAISIGLKDMDIYVRMHSEKDNALFTFNPMSLRAFKNFMARFKVFWFDEETYNLLMNWKRRHGEIRCNPQLPTYLDPRTNQRRPKTTVPMIMIPLSKLILEHPHFQHYNRLVFNPTPQHFDNSCEPKDLNLWSGFAFERDDVAGYTNWELIRFLLNHINYTLADDERQFNQILARMAMVLQYPWIKQEVCMAFGGGEGTGKSIVFEQFLGTIIGLSHFAHLQNSSEVFGEFNAILRKLVLAFLDEVNKPGEKENDNWKNLITAVQQRVREMYKEVYYQTSYVSFVTASNHIDKLVNVDIDSRRFEVYFSYLQPLLQKESYQEIFQGDAGKYFDLLIDDMKHNDWTGLKTFANFLYNLPLENFEYRKAIDSQLLWYQKYHNFSPIVKWWMECLLNGQNTFLAGPIQNLNPPLDPNNNNNNQQQQAVTYSTWKETYLLSSLHSYYYEKSDYSDPSELTPQQEFNQPTIKQVMKRRKKENDIDFWQILKPYLPEEVILTKNNEIQNLNLERCQAAMRKKFTGFDHFGTNKTCEETKKERVKKVTDDELLKNYLPANFFGVNIREQGLTIRRSNEFEPINHSTQHSKNKERQINDARLKTATLATLSNVTEFLNGRKLNKPN